MDSAIVFSKGKIGNLSIKNRIVRSATYENAATTDGEVTDALVEMYRNLGKGGTGLIVTGIAAVMSKYHFPHRAMLIDDDRFISGISRIAKAVHDLDNDTRIMLQLHLPGRQVMGEADTQALVKYLSPALQTVMMEKMQDAADADMETGAQPDADVHPAPAPVAPSAIKDMMFDRFPHALRVDEINEITDAFAQGARRARDAGFDGIQLHAAHGWLLSSFLSPHTNRRDDAYGGSTENRMRIIKDIIEKSRKQVKQDFPILIKINTTDFFPDGTDMDEAVTVCRDLEKMGFDAIEVSGGMWETVTRNREELGFAPYLLPEARTGINRKELEAYFYPAAREIREHVKLPLMLVGGIKSLDKCEEVLSSGDVDFISMSRSLLRQPDLPNLWQKGESTTADCISCNACVVGGDDITSCKQI